MFENIRLKQMTYTKNLRSIDHPSATTFHITDGIDAPVYFPMNMQQTSFVLSGTWEMAHIHPVSTYAEKNLLNIQVFTLAKTDAAYYTDRSDYPYYLMIMTYSGEGELSYENKYYHLNAGTIAIIDCRKKHKYKTVGSQWEHAQLHFYGHRADWFYERFCEDSSVVFSPKSLSPHQKNLEDLLQSYQTVSPYRETEVSMQLEHFLLELIKEKYAALLNVPDYIVYLQQYLYSNFSRAMSLDDIAAFTGFSKYHLEREFRKYTGHTIVSYIIDLRLNCASMMLRQSDMSIEQIAQSSGFPSYHSFLKAFKKHFGITPAEYRK